MKKKRLFLATLVAIIAIVAIATVIGAGEEPWYETPDEPIAMLWNPNDTSTAHLIPAPNDNGVRAFFEKNSEKIRPVDFSNNELSGEAAAIWVHPSLLKSINAAGVQQIKDRLEHGVPIVYMDKDADVFFTTFGIRKLGMREVPGGNDKIVGIAVRYNMELKRISHYMAISASSDRIAKEGAIPGLNALVSASNRLIADAKGNK